MNWDSGHHSLLPIQKAMWRRARGLWHPWINFIIDRVNTHIVHIYRFDKMVNYSCVLNAGRGSKGCSADYFTSYSTIGVNLTIEFSTIQHFHVSHLFIAPPPNSNHQKVSHPIFRDNPQCAKSGCHPGRKMEISTRDSHIFTINKGQHVNIYGWDGMGENVRKNFIMNWAFEGT